MTYDNYLFSLHLKNATFCSKGSVFVVKCDYLLTFVRL